MMLTSDSRSVDSLTGQVAVPQPDNTGYKRGACSTKVICTGNYLTRARPGIMMKLMHVV
jgi:hypothetical protein